jgi:putative nucleotidyltransferase with HDIG domain
MQTHESPDEQFSRLIGEAGNVILNGDSLTETLEQLAIRLSDIFKASACLITLVDFSRNDIECRACCGFSHLERDTEMAAMRHRLSEFFQDGSLPWTTSSGAMNEKYPTYTEQNLQRIWIPMELNSAIRMILFIYFPKDVEIGTAILSSLKSAMYRNGSTLRASLLYNRYLDAFHLVSTSIHSGIGVDDILGLIVRHAAEIMGAKGSIFWIVNDQKQSIDKKLVYGFPYGSLANVGFSDLSALFKSDSSGHVIIEDARHDIRIPDLERLGKKRVVSIIGIPLPIVDEYRGILAVYFGRSWKPVHREVHFLKSLAEQGAIALHRALRYDHHMLETFKQTISGLSLAIEARDGLTHGHSLKVAEFARMTATQMGLSHQETETVFHAGLLHDIGKIGIRDHHLDKLGALSQKELDQVKKHPAIGAGILKPLPFLQNIALLVLYHHERHDGSGYPEGLKGAHIPLGARILAVCDVFETMISGRPNMPARPIPDAFDQIRHLSGTYFDPVVVNAFLAAVQANVNAVQPFSSCSAAEDPVMLMPWMKQFPQAF